MICLELPVKQQQLVDRCFCCPVVISLGRTPVESSHAAHAGGRPAMLALRQRGGAGNATNPQPLIGSSERRGDVGRHTVTGCHTNRRRQIPAACLRPLLLAEMPR
ncbi:hypothetical protein ASPVEDRAFT_419317 [Aspergillus versicolor CBS 583.65]|uniref:Uncharacterized protein n=1 Tax=Aspergillus versicolor CBS 583.65 TaxID=1036611 RepID=A0A1L9Q538_ASPVE|nr:uncharacterized protein ASPVEDRAFT_419317 [Aspergillus versicolor CBS 583.65]OJJ08883.1 hypothetical protein ASPVEDRAFT_419317 [Aspergillus versicolor CBS 583.65]